MFFQLFNMILSPVFLLILCQLFSSSGRSSGACSAFPSGGLLMRSPTRAFFLEYKRRFSSKCSETRVNFKCPVPSLSRMGASLSNEIPDTTTIMESNKKQKKEKVQSSTGRGGGGFSESKSTSSPKKRITSAKNGFSVTGYSNSGVGAAKRPTEAPFNVNAAVRQLEKKYDELMRAATKSMASSAMMDNSDDMDEDNDYESTTGDDCKDESDTVTMEYMIAARALGYIEDWVPIAQLCIAREYQGVSEYDDMVDKIVRTAPISLYRRELSFVASNGSKRFQSVPRQSIQYSIEHIDSFQKHVYDVVMQSSASSTNSASGGSSSSSSSGIPERMTKQEARNLLQLTTATTSTSNEKSDVTPLSSQGIGTRSIEDDFSEVKRQYRKLSFQWHPDRFPVGTSSPEDIEAAKDQFLKIRMAYDTLTSGIRSSKDSVTGKTSNPGTVIRSWYESLGGKSRTDFYGPIQLASVDDARQLLEKHRIQAAICGLDPSLVQTFVTRCTF